MRRSATVALLAVLAGFGLLNFLAWHHARAMMIYTTNGGRTESPASIHGWAKLRALTFGPRVPRPETGRTPKAAGLSYESLRIAVGETIHLDAWHIPAPGSATLAVLFHGYASEKSTLLTEATLFHALACDVVLVDFRGSGGSSESLTTIGGLEADDVAATFHAARRRWPAQRLLLYGQSMGAAAIFRAVAERGVRPDLLVAEGLFDTMLQAVKNRFRMMGVPAFPGAELLVFWGGRRAGFNGFAHQPVVYASRIACPVLFLHGTTDRNATIEQARRVYARVAAPKVFVEFEGVGHVSPAAHAPGRWKSALAEFLTTSSASSGEPRT